ncbi:MAG TPA: response regulator [Clostridia bacterium]|nr:response regulator [Clostridia bacterium]
MNDRQVDMLMETAQKTFINELGYKIAEMEELFSSCKNECSEADTSKVLRFFHSINGTASTIGLDYISSIGKKWETKIRDLIDHGYNLNKNNLQDVHMAINTIKEKISSISEKSSTRKTPIDSSEYVNMPDRGKILLIDDDITILKLLENAFVLEGYQVYICDDSESVMDTIAVTRPDIIILDIIMPKLNGYEIMEKIKSRPEYSDIHVIFLSAKGEVNDKINGLKSGADDYITKPFVIGEITTKVEMIMRRSNNYKEKLLKDSLTDAYSRYFFNLRIAEELERYKRNGSIFSIAFIDMDHYKYINDHYGHQTGDYVLKELVDYIVGNIRECDSIFRYGGEEFIILMPDTTEEKAYIGINRLRSGFSSEPIFIGGSTLNVTFSAGIKQVCDKNESIDEIINDADKAMYYAKKCGRNRVVVYNKEISVHNLKRTLLIVDDENTILKLLRDRLSSIGYNVITAKDGNNAIKIAQEACPDAIVLDLILPDIDGFEVCRQIKENVITRSSRIIMLSKKKQKKNIVKGLYSGADDYVTKPFSMSELEARIMRVLNSTH